MLMRLLVVATGTTTAQPVFSSIKLHSVKLWSPSGGFNTPTAARILWDGQSSAEKFQSASDMSMTIDPAFVAVRPPPGSQPDWWMSSPTNTGIFTLQFSTGSVVDVDLSFLIDGNITALSSISGLTGLVSGNIYLGKLDGSSGILLPVGAPYYSA
jgi:hypothetical protein